MSSPPRIRRPLTEAATAAHAAAVAAGSPTYRDPFTGYTVMTAETLRARGHCCGNGCRHCPYDDETFEAARRAARGG